MWLVVSRFSCTTKVSTAQLQTLKRVINTEAIFSGILTVLALEVCRERDADRPGGQKRIIW